MLCIVLSQKTLQNITTYSLHTQKIMYKYMPSNSYSYFYYDCPLLMKKQLSFELLSPITLRWIRLHREYDTYRGSIFVCPVLWELIETRTRSKPRGKNNEESKRRTVHSNTQRCEMLSYRKPLTLSIMFKISISSVWLG